MMNSDYIARLQRGHEDLFDVGAKRDGVDRTVEHGRRGQRRRAERRDHRVGLPVATRRVIANARAAQAAGVAADEIRGHARFVDEDILARVAEWQRLMPPAPGGRDIRPTLFVGVYGFF